MPFGNSVDAYVAATPAVDREVTCAVNLAFILSSSAADGGATAVPDGQLLFVTSGWEHSCAIDEDNEPTCFGSNKEGELDLTKDAKFAQFALGTNLTCGLLTGGTIFCYGADAHEQATGKPEGSDWVGLDCGSTHCCAFDSASNVSCWGDDSKGQATPEL